MRDIRIEILMMIASIAIISSGAFAVESDKDKRDIGDAIANLIVLNDGFKDSGVLPPNADLNRVLGKYVEASIYSYGNSEEGFGKEVEIYDNNIGGGLDVLFTCDKYDCYYYDYYLSSLHPFGVGINKDKFGKPFDLFIPKNPSISVNHRLDMNRIRIALKSQVLKYRDRICENKKYIKNQIFYVGPFMKNSCQIPIYWWNTEELYFVTVCPQIDNFEFGKLFYTEAIERFDLVIKHNNKVYFCGDGDCSNVAIDDTDVKYPYIRGIKDRLIRKGTKIVILANEQ